jgi:hypothetical protein
MCERKTNRWIDLLDEALFSYRVTKGVTNRTPFQIFYTREPNFIFTLPENQENDIVIEAGVVEEEKFRISQPEFKIIYDALNEDVKEMRDKNAATMKKRWDTSNTQKVNVGDFVLVDTRRKLTLSKRPLGDPIFHAPGIYIINVYYYSQINVVGIVTEVFPSGNIKINWKEKDYYDDNIIANNKFKCVSKEV